MKKIIYKTIQFLSLQPHPQISRGSYVGLHVWKVMNTWSVLLHSPLCESITQPHSAPVDVTALCPNIYSNYCIWNFPDREAKWNKWVIYLSGCWVSTRCHNWSRWKTSDCRFVFFNNFSSLVNTVDKVKEFVLLVSMEASASIITKKPTMNTYSKLEWLF